MLEQFSATNPPPSSDSSLWTLDGLFFLPRMRLKYYQKLYNRLLKNTDNRLLIDAVDTLNMLIATLDSRQTIQVGDQNLAISVPPALDREDEVVVDMMRTEASSSSSTAKALRTEVDVVTPASESNSNRDTSSWEGYGYFPFYTGNYSFVNREHISSYNRASTHTISMPITDLERRLVTDRTLDIFTMTPKVEGSLYDINDS